MKDIHGTKIYLGFLVAILVALLVVIRFMHSADVVMKIADCAQRAQLTEKMNHEGISFTVSKDGEFSIHGIGQAQLLKRLNGWENISINSSDSKFVFTECKKNQHVTP